MPESTIFTDEYYSYNGLDQQGYTPRDRKSYRVHGFSDSRFSACFLGLFAGCDILINPALCKVYEL